jgi:hypothetical protein
MSVTDELLTGQAQHLIGALIAHNLLPKSMPSEQYLALWDVVKRQLNAVNKEGARAIQEEAYKAGIAAAKQIPPDADADDWNQAAMVVWVLARKHDSTIPSHWLDAMRAILEVK